MERDKIYLSDLGRPTCEFPVKGTAPTAVVLDGDGFAYIIGWSFSNEFNVTKDLVSELNSKVDNFINTILLANKATHLIGILEAETDLDTPSDQYIPVTNFRTRFAVSQPYKGKRPPKPDWYRIWAPYVQARLIDRWNFQRVPGEVEADDLVVSIVHHIKKTEGINTVLAGNDKDLHQCEGVYYNYKLNESTYITEIDAVKSLYYQVLIGDSTDNIRGLKGCGPKTAKAIIDNPKFNEKSAYMYTLREFVVKLGEDAGIRAFCESYHLCKLLTDLSVTGYYLTEFKPEESEVLQQMRELLGDREVDQIIVEQNLDGMNFSGSDLFKV